MTNPCICGIRQRVGQALQANKHSRDTVSEPVETLSKPFLCIPVPMEMRWNTVLTCNTALFVGSRYYVYCSVAHLALQQAHDCTSWLSMQAQCFWTRGLAQQLQRVPIEYWRQVLPSFMAAPVACARVIVPACAIIIATSAWSAERQMCQHFAGSPAHASACEDHLCSDKMVCVVASRRYGSGLRICHAFYRNVA